MVVHTTRNVKSDESVFVHALFVCRDVVELVVLYFDMSRSLNLKRFVYMAFPIQHYNSSQRR